MNFPRNLFVWRANLISSSGKGHEYFLKHLLGTTNGLMNDDSDSIRPEEIKWREQAPEGKLDLLINLDFRMAGTALYSDISCRRRHGMKTRPQQHGYAPVYSSFCSGDLGAVGIEVRLGYFKALSKAVSDLAEEVEMEPVKEVVATPLLHDTMQELAQPFEKSMTGARANVKPFREKRCRTSMSLNGITNTFFIK